MASAPASSSETCLMEDHLTCSICMDTFQDPVTTTCGHSFCKECLKLCYEFTEKACPMCKTPLRRVPGVNIVLRDIVQQRKVEKMKEEDEDIYTDRKVVMADDFYTEQKREDLDNWARHCVHFLEEDLGFVSSEDKQEKKSLHVCQICGWSKVTTYRGLRIHQGKKGCTPKGMKIPKTEQDSPQKHWEAEVRVEMRRQSSRKLNFKEENLPKAPSRMVHLNSAAATTNNGYNSAFAASQHSSLRSRKSERTYQQQHDFSTLPRVARSVREPPMTQPPVVRPKERRVYPTLSQISDNGARVENQRATQARIKEEPKSPPPPPLGRATLSGPPPPPPLGRATLSGPPPPPLLGRATLSGPPPPPLKRAILSGPPPPPPPLGRATLSGPPPPPLGRATLSGPPPLPLGRATLSVPPPLPLGRVTLSGPPPFFGRVTVSRPPPPGVRPKEIRIKHQTSQIADNKAMEETFQATAATIKAEPTSPSAIPQWLYQGSTNPQSVYQLPDFSTGVQAISSYYQPQVNGLTRESPPTPPSATAVQPKEKDGNDKARQERLKVELQQKIQMRKEKMSRPAERPCKNKPDPTSSTSSQTNSASAAEEENTTTEQDQRVDGTTGTSARLLTESVPKSTNTYQENTTTTTTRAAAASTTREDPSVEGSSCISSHPVTEAKQFSATTVQQTTVQPQEQDRERQKPSQTGPNSTTTDQANTTKATTKEDPKPYCETAEPGFSTAMKVKELARMFSATTTQETAGRPQKKHKESQAVPESVGSSQAPAAAAAEATTKEEPASLKTTHPDVSTGLKVRELAVMFSGTTTQATAGRPWEKQPPTQAKLLAQQFSATRAQQAAVQPKEKKAYSKKVSDSSGATTPVSAETTTEEVPKSSCETAEFLDFSTGVRVKDLARMFSAATNQKTIQPKGKNV